MNLNSWYEALTPETLRTRLTEGGNTVVPESDIHAHSRATANAGRVAAGASPHVERLP